MVQVILASDEDIRSKADFERFVQNFVSSKTGEADSLPLRMSLYLAITEAWNGCIYSGLVVPVDTPRFFFLCDSDNRLFGVYFLDRTYLFASEDTPCTSARIYWRN